MVVWDINTSVTLKELAVWERTVFSNLVELPCRVLCCSSACCQSLFEPLHGAWVWCLRNAAPLKATLWVIKACWWGQANDVMGFWNQRTQTTDDFHFDWISKSTQKLWLFFLEIVLISNTAVYNSVFSVVRRCRLWRAKGRRWLGNCSPGWIWRCLSRFSWRFRYRLERCKYFSFKVLILQNARLVGNLSYMVSVMMFIKPFFLRIDQDSD